MPATASKPRAAATRRTTAPIVVGTDFSKRSAAAVARAAKLAASTGAPLAIVHAYLVASPGPVFAIPEPLVVSAPSIYEDAVEEAAAARARAIDRLRGVKTPDGLDVERVAELGPPYAELAAAAKVRGASLIVVGVRTPEATMEKYLLGSVAERVLRTGHCPVLLVRTPPTADYKKILIAVDFTPVSIRAVETARALRPDAKFILGTVLPGETRRRVPAERRKAAEDGLRLLAEKTGLDPASTEYAVVSGDARHGILGLGISHKPNLLVVGTHARTGLSRMLLGSVAEFVARAAPVDVLAVPPEA